MTASTGALRIGGNSIWGEYFAGLIDEAHVYNRALSAAEVTTDMNLSARSERTQAHHHLAGQQRDDCRHDRFGCFHHVGRYQPGEPGRAQTR